MHDTGVLKATLDPLKTIIPHFFVTLKVYYQQPQQLICLNNLYKNKKKVDIRNQCFLRYVGLLQPQPVKKNRGEDHSWNGLPTTTREGSQLPALVVASGPTRPSFPAGPA